jgi:uncharacterized protein (DUF4415 family)
MNISPKRLEEINNIPDLDIDTSDIPELDDHFWQNAKMVKLITKKAISIRLDSDILDWFKSRVFYLNYSFKFNLFKIPDF